jgi:hypothetical protein
MKIWKIDKFKNGDNVVFLDTPTTYKHGVILKVKGGCPEGESSGNVLIETDDGRFWVYGSKIMDSVESAEKQIKFNLKSGGEE